MSTRPRTTSPAPQAEGETLAWAKKRMDRALKAHGPRCNRYKQREDAWLASRKRTTDPPRVRFAYERMDVLLSYITAEKQVGRVAPKQFSPKCIEAAKIMDKAINVWRRRDDRDLKQYEWKMQALVYGVSPAKSFWAYERVEETYRAAILDPVTGDPAGIETKTRWVDARNQPSLVIVNPYDFAWDPAAVHSNLSDAEYVCYWTYPSLRGVRAKDVKRGTKNDPGYYHNTDLIAETTPRAGQTANSKLGQARDLTGRVEICEIWTRDRLVVIANGQTCIRDEENPFQHHDLPFIIGTTMPNLTGSIETSSEVELITGIQEDLWEIRRQYRLNLRLANKLITLFNGTMGSTEQIVNALRGDDAFVAIPIDPENGDNAPITWSPTSALLQNGLEGMDAYKKDMDDMSGVGPYVSGDTETAVDPKTATEITTLQGAAMRRINKTRNMLNAADQRAANLELKLANQFLPPDQPLTLRIDGYDAEATVPGKDWSWLLVDPQKVLDTDLEYVIRDADENLDQQQKRAEANARFQQALAAAPIMMSLGQPTPNLEKEYENFLEAYGEEDAKDYILQPPPPPPVMAPGVPPGIPPNGAGGALGASPLGSANPLGGPGRAAPIPSNGVAG